MPKDNENIPFPGPIEPSEPQGFSPDQMIRCEECLRANPPTRVSCLYCVAPLPLTESSLHLRRPDLRQPEKHQAGYNNILLPQEQVVSDRAIDEAAGLLKLSAVNLRDLVSQAAPLPVARTASREEAELVSLRLRDLGLSCAALSDEELGLSFETLRRVRSLNFDDASLTIHEAGETEATRVAWSEIILILSARLVETRLEVKERKTRKTESEIIDTSEFFKDETVLDFYTASHASTWRITATGFDYSCLGAAKTLIANENIGKLKQLFLEKAVNAQIDDSYARLRPLLELAWATNAETQSNGWRRERPGMLTVGVATIRSNETQFTRYSRLQHYYIHR